jgi:hypothetical protein
MSEPDSHERGLALFIVGNWRFRFRESLASGKRRDKLRSQLPHFSHLEPRFATLVPTSQQRGSILLSLLREKGAGEACYLLSEDDDLDGRQVSLREALSLVVDANSHHATFISCVPGRLAYFHDEEPESRYLLEHPA